MKNKIEILSREAAELRISEGFSKNTAVISFYDEPRPNYKPNEKVDYTGKCNRVFYVCQDDIAFEELSDYNITVDTFMPEADKLADYKYCPSQLVYNKVFNALKKYKSLR